jgi:hypothetical protein
MQNFKKYLPFNLLLLIFTLIVWYIAGHVDRNNLRSPEYLAVWIPLVFISFGIIDVSRPKDK